MTPGQWDDIVPQGTTWSVVLTYDIDGVPVNLTGWSARMHVRHRHEDAAPAVALSSEPGDGIVLGGAAGTIAISMTEAQTRGLWVADMPDRVWPKTEIYVYDLELVEPSGGVRRLIEGRFTVTREVTR